MTYDGYYINLERSADRRARIETELATHGLTRYTRFVASEGNAMNFPSTRIMAGEMGCFTSHYRLMESLRGQTKPAHVIEDDIILSAQAGPVLQWLVSSGQLEKFDIIMTDVAVPLLSDACHAYKTFYDAAVKRGADGCIEKVNFCVINMRELIFGSTCSMLVNHASFGKIADLYGAALRTGATLPVDLFIREQAQKDVLRVGCVFPFVTSIRPESCYASIIGASADQLSSMASNMLRHSFFIDCDWNACLAQACESFPQPKADDTHRQLMKQLLGFSLLEGYKKI